MKKLFILLLTLSILISGCTASTSEENISENEIKNIEKNNTSEVEQEVKSAPAETLNPTPTETVVELPKEVAVVIARDSYTDSEFNPVMQALKSSGYNPIIVSDELGMVTGKNEYVEVDSTLSELNGEELLGIVLIGGSYSLWDNTELYRLLNEVNDLERVVAAICISNVILAKAGIIGEGDVACWLNNERTDNVMSEFGVEDTELSVTVNGTIITGDGIPAAEEFSDEIIIALNALN